MKKILGTMTAALLISTGAWATDKAPTAAPAAPPPAAAMPAAATPVAPAAIEEKAPAKMDCDALVKEMKEYKKDKAKTKEIQDKMKAEGCKMPAAKKAKKS